MQRSDSYVTSNADELLNLPLAEERLHVGKRELQTGRVNVSTETEERVVHVSEDLTASKIDVQRVPVGQFVDVPPEVRQEGDVTIIPVVEEMMVKRLFLREEVRITRVQQISSFEQDVTLRRQDATVERAAPPASANPTQG